MAVVSLVSFAILLANYEKTFQGHDILFIAALSWNMRMC